MKNQILFHHVSEMKEIESDVPTFICMPVYMQAAEATHIGALTTHIVFLVSSELNTTETRE